MKNIFKKITAILLLVLSVNAFMFSKENEKSLLELTKEVITLKHELYQIEHRYGEYEEMSSFSLYFEKAKKEHLLKKRQAELKERSEENQAEAEKALAQAQKELSKTFSETGKDLEKLGKDIGNAFSDFFNN